VVQFKSGAGDFRLLRNVQTGPVTRQPPVQWVNGKGKGHPKQATKVQKGKRYSYTFSFTSALDWVGGQHHAPAALPPGRTQYPLYRRLGGPQGRSGRAQKISPSPGFDSRTGKPPAVAIATEVSQPPNH
jgi:hypothetical protein